MARKHTTDAIATLCKITRDAKPPAAARTAAAVALLDRGYGRPAQAIEATFNRKSVAEMTDDELLAIAAGAEDGPSDDDEPPANSRKH